ncbi:hypothetical protein MN116_001442 [Schistosoma mekongi]|uniref:PHD finger-like domain-containing protein 5A n=1 Tax=Schistosoma mekongi TaxID=38744 RepID=A0AAE1ZMF5_SCHME|nr:hypothetical protein MN116_001442 [Schistosoma mekongi]
MAKHHPDLIFCRKQPGVAIGRLCEKCDGKCVICDSYVRPCTLVRICDECNYGSYQGRCVICGGPGVSDAYYCRQCTCLEKDENGSLCLKKSYITESASMKIINILEDATCYSIKHKITIELIQLDVIANTLDYNSHWINLM